MPTGYENQKVRVIENMTDKEQIEYISNKDFFTPYVQLIKMPETEIPKYKPDDTLEKRLIEIENSIKKLNDKIDLIFGNHIFIDGKPTKITL